MEAADRHLDPGGAETTRQVERARKLVGLHAHQADQAEIGGLEDGGDRLRHDPRVGLVIGVGFEPHVLPEHPPLGAIGGDPVERGETVRGNGRELPLDDITVIVIMRRLDQMQLEHTLDHDRTSEGKSKALHFEGNPTLNQFLTLIDFGIYGGRRSAPPPINARAPPCAPPSPWPSRPPRARTRCAGTGRGRRRRSGSAASAPGPCRRRLSACCA